MSGKTVKIGISVFVLVFAIEYLVNMVLFENLFTASKAAGIPWHNPTLHDWIGQVVAVALFACVFTRMFLRLHAGGGALEGIRFGLSVWVLASVFEVIGYATSIDFGRKLTIEQLGADLAAFVIAGAAAGALAADAGKAKSAAA